MISRISLKQDKIIVLEFCIPEQCRKHERMSSHSYTGHLSLWQIFLDWWKGIQSFWRWNWVWPARNKATQLLEHILLQDLSRYDVRPAAQVHCHLKASRLSVFTDRWRKISQYIPGSWHVEEITWWSCLFTAQL